MRKLPAAAAILLPALLLLGAGPSPDTQDFSLIERGKYLTGLADCAACHTNPGGPAFAGGRPIETPFGVIVAPNITPDEETGIGRWSDDDFVRLLQSGIGRGGEHIYPAMPYNYTTHATKADDLAIRAWLATIPAVHNKVVANQLPFPLNIRAAMIGWNALFFTPGVYKPDTTKSPEWNRGAYLVTGLEHCGACHTTKNIAGGDETSRTLQGGVLQGWFAPNITNDARRGIGKWSEDDVVAYLKSGHNRYAAASGPMAEEVMLSSSHSTDADLHAMVTYLKSIPGQDDAPSANAAADTMQHGSAIYADECSACHAPHGEGIAGLFPSIAQAPSIQSRAPTSLIRVVLQGAKSAGTDAAPTAPAMPAFGWMMTDAQVAAVVTYIRNNWGNSASSVTAGEVRSERASLAKRTE